MKLKVIKMMKMKMKMKYKNRQFFQDGMISNQKFNHTPNTKLIKESQNQNIQETIKAIDK